MLMMMLVVAMLIMAMMTATNVFIGITLEILIRVDCLPAKVISQLKSFQVSPVARSCDQDSLRSFVNNPA